MKGSEKKPTVTLFNEVECDEAYVIAGHKGQPEVVKSKGQQGRRRRRKGKAGRGTLEKDRPPVCGMMQRGGQVVITLLANVQQKTIEPVIKDTSVADTRVYTDEYRRSWLRPHRGIAQEKLPLYLGFFEFVHNVRKRGKALLGALIELLVTHAARPEPHRGL